MDKLDIKSKKVLIFGLGILGGGVATANWFLKQGAKITITDLKSKNQLRDSLKKIKGKYRLSLGGHRKSDIDVNEIIVVNPDVSIKNEFIKYAYSKNKIIINEASIFFENFGKHFVAVTGTRGKTTTTAWINHFLRTKFKTSLAGNSIDYQFLKVLNKKNWLDASVVEISSFHLEYFNDIKSAPDIAVITNIYQDHLNRHSTVKNYALTKANIFKNQNRNQNLILNYDNKWTKLFLRLKPKSKVWFFSLASLPLKLNGIYYYKNIAVLNLNKKRIKVLNLSNFEEKRGNHNLQNLLVSSLAAYLFGIKWNDIQKSIKTLPSLEFRQEEVYKNKNLTIINDTTATSPEGGIAALNRFGGPNTVLITGGTDKNLDYREWCRVVFKKIKSKNLIFISGSSTDKMLGLLKNKIKKPLICRDLRTCIIEAFKIIHIQPKSILLFSPASKSFEKFKNEYDRGEKFNVIIKKFINKNKVI